MDASISPSEPRAAPFDGVFVPFGEMCFPARKREARLHVSDSHHALGNHPGGFMFARSLLLVGALALHSSALLAQHGTVVAPAITVNAPPEASQYDFLQGHWSLVVTPKVSRLVARIHGAPHLRGTWRGMRALDGWGTEDELRISDASGNPIAYTHFLRIYDPRAHRWTVTAIDVYRQGVTTYTAQKSGNEMLALADGTDPDGKPYRTRTHFTDITATGFHFSQDVSHDGGATWDEGHLVMDATRESGTSTK
jgi:hypothetical protein